MTWYNRSIVDVTNELGVDIAIGLSDAAADERKARYGSNRLDEKPPRTFMQRFVNQMKDAMILILLAAAALSCAISLYHASRGEPAEWIEPLVIVLIVVINGVLGSLQEGKAEEALEALKKMSMPQVKTRRNGRVMMLPSVELMPGDVVLLEAGDIVPADCRIAESASLKSDEASLTGESFPVEKNADDGIPGEVPLGDRTNMLYAGCAITNGRGTAVVVETGMQTEMGKIAALLSREEDRTTPLQRKLAQLGRYLGLIALFICAVIFAMGVLEKLPLMEMFMTAISLAVAAIPEGLPAIVTVVLAIGVRKMVASNVIIRKLPAVETLGSTSVICSDKTGTLTQNRMTLIDAYASGKLYPIDDTKPSEAVCDLLSLFTLCTDGSVTSSGDGVETHIGDPTETAVIAAALRKGITKISLEGNFPRVGEIPFDSDRKLMTTINRKGEAYLVVVKGAPDVLLARCTDGDIDGAFSANREMSEKALRVIAVASKELKGLPQSFYAEELENGLTLAGLVGMIDPPREEVKDSIKECDQAGIRTIMITGDHIATASAIARELGILKEGKRAISGVQLAEMGEESLRESIDEYRVYARVSPADKIRIVKAWQQNGQVVAMTGDGVNDAPALKAADIGCAMGITGTEVSKGAADMILTDDNFATIVTAVREGRGIYDNIRKAVRFLLSCNLGEVLTVFVAMFVWKESPLLPVQILWVNLVTDSFPALALGMERIDPDIMGRVPRGKDESLFADGVGVKTVLEGVMIGLLTLTGYYVGSRAGIENAGVPLGGTMAFAVLALSQLVHAQNVRSAHSLFHIGFFSNRYMVQAFSLSFLLMLTVLLVPAFRDVFKLVGMNAGEWAIVSGLSLAPLFLYEAAKAMRKA